MIQVTRPPTNPLPDNNGKSELTKFIRGFSYAGQGLWYTLRTQRNARFHAVVAILVIIMGIWLRITAFEFAIVFLAIAAVFVCEMINTVMEICVDLASPDYHPLAKIAKDVAAGAVLVNAIISAIVGLFIFLPHLWLFFFR